ncbi:MAG: cysteine-rich repeat protein [Flavobacteriales bacterium]|jgi:cysteine-rich repeat protein
MFARVLTLSFTVFIALFLAPKAARAGGTQWRVSQWTECSVECGDGVETRSVVCVGGAGEIVPDELCPNPRPETAQACNRGPCTGSWSASGWSACSAECGGGVETRTVTCISEGGVPRPDEACTDRRPPTAQICGDDSCDWLEGEWSACSVECGGGVEVRSLDCVTPTGASVPEASCTDDRPLTAQPCNDAECICGDGTTDAGEECDDGNSEENDGCSSLCTSEEGWDCHTVPGACAPVWNDGQVVGDEACDDGNVNTGDGCHDGTVEDGWGCDDAQPSECVEDDAPSVCGDAVLDAGETCDDGNESGGDGCSDECLVEDGWSCDGVGPDACTENDEPDAGTDAGADAGADAETDAGSDAESDAGVDAGADAGSDVEADVRPDVESDIEVDIEADAEPDVLADTAVDVAPDTADERDVGGVDVSGPDAPGADVDDEGTSEDSSGCAAAGGAFAGAWWLVAALVLRRRRALR